MAPTRSSRLAPAFAASALVVLLGASSALFGVCGPFTDVAADAFCPFVLEIFYLGITTGTTPTTYDPTSNVNRLQMAAFLSRSVDGVLKRGSHRAALQQFWTTQNASVLGLTTVGLNPLLLQSDGLDVWVANLGSNSVSHVRGTDGKLLETWTGATFASAVLVAMGRVFVTGRVNPGNLYRIDPTQTAGVVTTVASNLGAIPLGVAFDGSRIWTANPGASVSIVTPGAVIPWTVTTVTTGFSTPQGNLYDGANIWVADADLGLLKLDSSGAILQTVTVGINPFNPAFDGGSIWVPNSGSDSLSVVRASSGAVLQTLTGNGLSQPISVAFDGQRMLVTNFNGNSVSLWKAADLTPIGFSPTGSSTVPYGACSDGVNFWITLTGMAQLARF
jgi:DNA-binding beta-propeller fold protein YncE